MGDKKNSVFFSFKAFALIIILYGVYAAIKLIIRMFVHISDLDNIFAVSLEIIVLSILFTISLFFSVTFLKPFYLRFPKTIFLVPILTILIIKVIEFLLLFLMPPI